MSPVSMLPSFSTTRCATESLFLKTTICPPRLAGLGEKACVPLWPRIVIVAGPVVDGELGVEPPPPQPPTTTTAINASDNSWSRIPVPSQSPPTVAQCKAGAGGRRRQRLANREVLKGSG